MPLQFKVIPRPDSDIILSSWSQMSLVATSLVALFPAIFKVPCVTCQALVGIQPDMFLYVGNYPLQNLQADLAGFP